MLFTRCPDCQTNFRITADALRKADGQVRCGHCSAVFNAYEGLRDGSGPGGDTPPPEDPGNAEFDSLSETDEYIALDEGEEELATHDEPEATTAPEEESESESLPQMATESEQESAIHVDDEGPIVEEEPEPSASSEQSLEFNLPPDEWTTFFQHAVRHPLADDLPEGGGAFQPATEAPAEDARSLDDIVVGEFVEEDESESETDMFVGDDTEEGVSRVVQVPESDDAAAEFAEAMAPDSVSETTVVVEESDFPQEDEALLTEGGTSEEEDVLVADTDEVVADVMAIGGPIRNMPPWAQWLESHRWTVGSTLFATVLLTQTVHHFRGPLSGQPLVGPVLQAAYSTAGVELAPQWDLAQYEIMDWVATADAGAAGPGSLQISARIHNRGPRAQPYPNVRLELKDRWEATVGSRVFTAAEYLPKDVAPERIMDAGTTVPASLQVVDPGQDAYGFELDICAELEGGGLRCASDAVFQ